MRYVYYSYDHSVFVPDHWPILSNMTEADFFFMKISAQVCSWGVTQSSCFFAYLLLYPCTRGRKSDWVSALSTCSIVIIPSLPTKIEEGNWIDNFVSRKRCFVWSMPIGWVGVQSNSITLVFWSSTFERFLGGQQTPSPQKEFLISTAAHSAPPLTFQTTSLLCVNNVLDVYVNVTWLIDTSCGKSDIPNNGRRVHVNWV